VSKPGASSATLGALHVRLRGFVVLVDRVERGDEREIEGAETSHRPGLYPRATAQTRRCPVEAALRRDGTPLSIAFTVSLLTEPGTDKVTRVVAVIRDDTVRWQARREMNAELTRLRADPRLTEPSS